MPRILLQYYTDASAIAAAQRNVTSASPASLAVSQPVSAQVLVLLGIGVFALVSMLIGAARFACMHLANVEARERAGVDVHAAAVAKEAAEMELKRVTPVVVIQPDHAVDFGLKEKPHGKLDEKPAEGRAATAAAARLKRMYVVSIPDFSELSHGEAEEVLRGIEAGQRLELASRKVCRDSVSSCSGPQ